MGLSRTTLESEADARDNDPAKHTLQSLVLPGMVPVCNKRALINISCRS